MKPGHWYCELWKSNFYFCVGWKEKDISKWLKKNWDYEKDFHPVDGTTLEGTWDNGRGGGILIWIRKKTMFAELAHECVHAAAFAVDSRGWKFEANNHEPFAYLVETLFGKARRSA